MGIITYGAVAFIASAGLFCGYFIAHHTREELKTGSQYFLLLKQAILSAMIGVSLILTLSVTASVLVACLIFFGLLLLHSPGMPKVVKKFSRTIDLVRNLPLVYFLLGIDFFLATHGFARLIPSLIFLYGFPAGSLLFYKNGTMKQAVVPVFLFLITAIGLYFLF